MTNVIYTKSVLAAIHSNNLTQNIIYDVIHNPDRKLPGKTPDSNLFQKNFDWGSVNVVAKYTETGEWLAISCWSKSTNKVSYNKHEYDPRLKKASFWGKIWIELKKIIGL